MHKPRILYVEDDLSLSFVTQDSLELRGYHITHCLDGEEALRKFAAETFDLCILDVMLPKVDGFSIAKKIRDTNTQIPILFLSAKSLKEDKIKGLQIGADDYITKPFSMKELVMRIDVFLRRTKKMHSENQELYRIGKMQFSFTDLKLETPLGVASLTQREADLLKFLCEHPNRVLKREEVLLNVWGKDDYFLGRSMDVFMAKLRKHFKADPEVVLETIHGVGFRFNVNTISTGAVK